MVLMTAYAKEEQTLNAVPDYPQDTSAVIQYKYVIREVMLVLALSRLNESTDSLAFKITEVLVSANTKFCKYWTMSWKSP